MNHFLKVSLSNYATKFLKISTGISGNLGNIVKARSWILLRNEFNCFSTDFFSSFLDFIIPPWFWGITTICGYVRRLVDFTFKAYLNNSNVCKWSFWFLCSIALFLEKNIHLELRVGLQFLQLDQTWKVMRASNGIMSISSRHLVGILFGIMSDFIW